MALELNVDFDEKLEQLAKVPKPIRLAVVSAVLVAIAGGYWFFSYKPAQEVHPGQARHHRQSGTSAKRSGAGPR